MISEEIKEKSNLLSNIIIGSAIEVHKQLGPGLLESVYEDCLCYELSQQKINFSRQVNLPVTYKTAKINAGFRIDLIVDNLVVVELKAVEQVLPVHKSQLLTYLKLSQKWLGLLINFNVPVLKDSIVRVVNG
jgi:GxxExxY protein